MGITKSLTCTREGRKSLPPQLSSKVKVSLRAGVRGCGRGGFRAESGGCRLEPSRGARRCLPAPPGVSLCCAGCDAAVALGSRVEFRAEGAGTWSRAGWGCGLRGTETLLGVRARDRAAGPRPSIVPAALAAGLAASSCQARCRAPRGSPRGPGPCQPPPRPAASRPRPPTRARPPGLGSRVGVGLRPRAAGPWQTGVERAPRVPGPRRPGKQVPPRRAGLPARGLRALPRDAPLPSPKVVPRTPELGSRKARKCAETWSRPCGWGLAPLRLSSVFIFCVLFPCKERSSCSPWPSC